MTESLRQQSGEEDLLRRAREGDPTAFEELISPYLQKAYAYALRQTGDPHVAEDVCQEAFLKAFRAIGDFAGNAAFSTWLFSIIYRTFLDHVRKHKVPVDQFPEEGEPAELGAEAVERFRDRVQSEERQAWLLSGIFRLPSELRAVIILRDLQGLSYKEVAEITGELEGTVKSRLFRAREKLREILTASAGEAPEGDRGRVKGRVGSGV